MLALIENSLIERGPVKTFQKKPFAFPMRPVPSGVHFPFTFRNAAKFTVADGASPPGPFVAITTTRKSAAVELAMVAEVMGSAAPVAPMRASDAIAAARTTKARVGLWSPVCE